MWFWEYRSRLNVSGLVYSDFWPALRDVAARWCTHHSFLCQRKTVAAACKKRSSEWTCALCRAVSSFIFLYMCFWFPVSFLLVQLWPKYCFFIFPPCRIQFFQNDFKAFHDLAPCFISVILVPHGPVRTSISSGGGLLSVVGWRGKSWELSQSQPWGSGRICRDQVSWVIDLF